MTASIGWDIGGAHLKAARAENGRIVAAAEAATPLWQGLDSLHEAFAALKARLGPADLHGVTMSGELCDAFARHVSMPAPSASSTRAEPPSTPPASPRPTGGRAPKPPRSASVTPCFSTSARPRPT